MDIRAHIMLDASTFHDLNGFYTAIYKLMTLYEDWQPAYSLDAFNDMLYSGFGKEPIQLIWVQSAKSKADLGLQATQEFYQRKIEQGKPYNVTWAEQQLEALNSGTGATLFDIIIDIFQSHKNIQLVLS